MVKLTVHTGEPRLCNCSVLQRVSSEENSPIEFDETVNEYAVVFMTARGRTKFVVHYCFYCGGRVPTQSRRAELFAKVEEKEKRRLNNLCAEIQTLDEVIKRFGNPDTDASFLVKRPKENEGNIGAYTQTREVSYLTLSKTAEVRFMQNDSAALSISISGKYIGLHGQSMS